MLKYLTGPVHSHPLLGVRRLLLHSLGRKIKKGRSQRTSYLRMVQSRRVTAMLQNRPAKHPKVQPRNVESRQCHLAYRLARRRTIRTEMAMADCKWRWQSGQSAQVPMLTEVNDRCEVAFDTMSGENVSHSWYTDRPQQHAGHGNPKRKCSTALGTGLVLGEPTLDR